MSSEIAFLVEEAPEAGYTARALGHSVFTQAETEQELREAVRDAVHCHFDVAEKPSVIRLHFSGMKCWQHEAAAQSCEPRQASPLE